MSWRSKQIEGSVKIVVLAVVARAVYGLLGPPPASVGLGNASASRRTCNLRGQDQVLQ